MNKQTALITGASSGIGLALSALFAREGYDLLMISQNEDRLHTAANRLQQQYRQVKIHCLPKDLSLPSSPQEIYAYTKEHSITVDILVNNAGIQVYGSFHEKELSDYMRLMAVNTNALVALTGLFVKDMCARKSGRILNIGSTGAFSPCPLNAVYCASKAFVLHFSEAIAEELDGTGVTVTTLCPGATKTNFARRAGIEHTRMFSGSTMEADQVAMLGYRALMRGNPVMVAGLRNKLLVGSIRLSPRKLVVKMGKGLMQSSKKRDKS